ncbi:MAG: CPBP family intramembrane glutamic endopeptidase [Patescibacteria group bacterium]
MKREKKEVWTPFCQAFTVIVLFLGAKCLVELFVFRMNIYYKLFAYNPFNPDMFFGLPEGVQSFLRTIWWPVAYANTWVWDFIQKFWVDQYGVLRIIQFPLLEELYFRAPLWFTRKYSRRPTWIFFLFFSGILFGFGHGDRPLAMAIVLSFLGLATGWLILKTNKLWPSICLHAAYNLVVISTGAQLVQILTMQ